MPEKLYNFKGTYSDLEIDSDDLSVYIARYPTLLAEVLSITLAADTGAASSFSAMTAAIWPTLARAR